MTGRPLARARREAAAARQAEAGPSQTGPDPQALADLAALSRRIPTRRLIRLGARASTPAVIAHAEQVEERLLTRKRLLDQLSAQLADRKQGGARE